MYPRVLCLTYFRFLSISPLGRLVGHKVLIGEMLKKFPNFCSNGYSEFSPQNWQKGVKICNSDEPFFGGGVELFLTYGRLSNF